MPEPTPGTVTVLNKQEVRDQLAALLQGHGATRITGSRLAPLIDSLLPTGTTHRLFVQGGKTANLRAFVEQYLEGLVDVTTDRSGTDPIYNIPPASPVTGKIRTRGMLWKSFVAVAPSRQLYFDRSTSELNVRESSAAASAETPTIHSVTIAEFEAMRGMFLTSLDEAGEVTPELVALLSCEVSATYQAWISRLKSTTPRLDRRWQEFRSDAIVHLFGLRLADLKVQGDRIEELKVQLLRDFEQARVGKVEAEPAAAPESGVFSSGGPKEPKDKHARELLHAVVDRMTMEQMQSLNIPFSIVLELIKNSPQ
ncbi:hypothetical protein PO883_26870 [Massilia sp. DJPM01]|uniref:hypothetical protein n=1 Tax=Massilia sp. DJPM01 TaxID=3024404 RepID=UPI00259F48D7|nr:hypothetical protein [Massilia sp. DJPM01]MDM5180810.1 hypothetical protein [Massilia sp. DJPM01]